MKILKFGLAALASSALLIGCAKKEIPIADQGTHTPPAGSMAAKALQHYKSVHGGDAAPAPPSGQ